MGNSKIIAHQLSDNYNIEDICGKGLLFLGVRGNWKAYKTKRCGIVFVNENMKVDVFSAYTTGKLDRVFMDYYRYSDFASYVRKFLIVNDCLILRIINRKKRTITFLNVQNNNFSEELILEITDNKQYTLNVHKTTQKNTQIIIRGEDSAEYVISAEKRVLAKYVTSFAFAKNKKIEQL